MREDNITKIFNIINEVGKIKLYSEDIRDTSVKIEIFEKHFKEISIEKFYSSIYTEFESLIYIQLENNCDIKLLEKFNNSAKTIFEYELSKHNFKLNSNAFQSQNFTDEEKKKYYFFNKIHEQQTDKIKKIIKLLEHEIEFFTYKNNKNLTINSTNTKDTHNILEKSNPHEKKDMKDSTNSINKATFNLSRTDSIIFLYMLEKFNLLKFESTSQRNRFIEQNFNYTEYRNTENASDENENIVKELTGINVEYSNVKSVDKSNVKRYNKRLDLLKDKIQFIMEYEFKS
ncbi:hypothetical protein [Flavobacterium sp.]|uniref:hypothetical protein n=1 Tax=Flavobacterium sp. TaxID=239 RepID=UPI0025DBDDC3|nr:hypothetical protein [Flavobacterium sp.]